MSEVQRMEVFDGADHLKEPETGLIFWNGAVFLHKVQQVAILGPAHEDEHRVAALQYAMDSDDVRVVNLCQHSQLAGEELFQEILRRLALVDVFAGQVDGLLGVRVVELRRHHIAVRSLADPLAKVIASSHQRQHVGVLTLRDE